MLQASQIPPTADVLKALTASLQAQLSAQTQQVESQATKIQSQNAQIETQVDMNLHSSQIAAVQELSNAYKQSYDAIIAGLRRDYLDGDFGIYGFVGAQGRAVGRNIFLDGNSFRSSAYGTATTAVGVPTFPMIPKTWSFS